MVVCVVDDVEQFAGLGQEGADFAVRPARNDAFAVMREGNREALQPGHLDSQQLLPVLAVPDPDFVGGRRGEHLGVVFWEGHVVYALVVAGVSELRSESGGVDPVDVRL